MILEEKIDAAKSVKDMDNLRDDVVATMRTNPSLLKKWQDKYWSLKRCPTCGKVR